MNSITIMGNVGKQPELKTTQSNAKFCNFSVAVNRVVKGEKKTQWFNVTAWNKTAEYVTKYIAKGTKILVQGRYETRLGVDKETGEEKEYGGITAESVYGLGNAQRDVEIMDAEDEREVIKNILEKKPDPMPIAVMQAELSDFASDDLPF